MDGLRQPVGEQPPQIYWRRRLISMAGVVLLVVVLWFLITSPSGESPASGASDSSSTTPTPDAYVADGSEEMCGPDNVRLTTTANPFTAAGSALPQFDVNVTHVGDDACLLDTTSDDTALVITSGSDRVWSSADCADTAALDSQALLLQPGAAEELHLTWSRQRSNPDCTTQTAEPRAGFYWAELTVQGIPSERVQFELAG
jgi:hypothetical protein